jgi:hypothetical protein
MQRHMTVDEMQVRLEEPPARQALDRYRERLAAGGFRLAAVVLGLFALGQVFRACTTAAGVGIGRFAAGGGVGAAVWSVIQIAIVIAIIRFAIGPLLSHHFGPIIQRGRIYPARITVPPATLIERLGSTFAFLSPLERLAARFVPLRFTTYEFEIDGRMVSGRGGALYDDESPVQREGSPLVLADPEAPERRHWLYRIR